MASSVTSIARMVSDRDTVTDSGLSLEEDSVSLESAAFSSDGTQLVTGSCGDTLRVWDVVSGHKIATYAPNHAPNQNRYSSLRCVAFSPDNFHIAGSNGIFGSRQLYIWNHVTERMTATLCCVDCFVYSPNGENIAVYGWTWIDNAVMNSFRVWNITTGSERTVFTTPSPTNVHNHPDFVFFSVDELCIALYTDTAQLQVWGVSVTDSNVPHLLSIPDSVLCHPTSQSQHKFSTLAFSSNGKHLILDLHDHLVKLRIDGYTVSMVTHFSLERSYGHHDKPVVSSDGRYVAVNGMSSGGFYLWDTLMGQRTMINDCFGALCFSPNAGILAASDCGPAIKLFRMESLDLHSAGLSKSCTKAESFVLSRDGVLMAVALKNGCLQLVNTASGTRSDLPARVSTGSYGWFAHFCNGGDRFVYRTSERDLVIYDLRNETCTPVPESKNTQWTMPLHGELIAAHCHDGRMRVWDANHGRVQATSDMIAEGTLVSLEFTANDSRLLCVFDVKEQRKEHKVSAWQTQLWDVKSCTHIFTLKPGIDDRFSIPECSPDGRCFATREQDAIVLRDTEDGHVITTYQRPLLSDRAMVHWSPDGSHFLLFEDNRKKSNSGLSLWCSRSGSQVSTLDMLEITVMEGFSSSQFLHFSADSSRIVWCLDSRAGCYIEGQHFPRLRDTTLLEEEAISDTDVDVDIATVKSGWLLYSCPDRAEPRQFLWVPPHRRDVYTRWVELAGSTIVLEGRDGLLTLLDMSGFLQLLSKRSSCAEGELVRWNLPRT
jgi:WD40 repeat protein